MLRNSPLEAAQARAAVRHCACDKIPAPISIKFPRARDLQSTKGVGQSYYEVHWFLGNKRQICHYFDTSESSNKIGLALLMLSQVLT